MNRGIHQLYKAYREGDESAKKVLSLYDWVSGTYDFDPKTGKPRDLGLSEFLWSIKHYNKPPVLRDPIWRIAKHVQGALRSIFAALGEEPRRELVAMPFRKVRELDAASLRRISSRPGRTIREKIAAKPTLPAPRHFMSIDVPENRLVKAFVRRFVELLELRKESLGSDKCGAELLPRLRGWLRGDDAKAIGPWRNTPPNNALLSHRDYRKVLDAWRRLQNLEAHNWGVEPLDGYLKSQANWKSLCEIWTRDEMSVSDIPVLLDETDVDTVAVPDYGPVKNLGLFGDVEGYHCPKDQNPEIPKGPLCIDLSSCRPAWTTITDQGQLPETFLHQRWQKDENNIEWSLFHATGYTQTDSDGWSVETVGLPDLLFRTNPPCAGAAAGSFCTLLKERFKNRDQMVWLVPDATSDFAASELRSAMALAFPFAEPLPRSVAAVLMHVKYADIRKGYRVRVIDNVGGILATTELIAKYDEQLKSAVPETKGYFWIRHPTTTREDCQAPEQIEIPEWAASSPRWKPIIPVSEDEVHKKRKALNSLSQLSAENEEPDCVITLHGPPTQGGLRFLELAEKAGRFKVAIWKDCLPRLSMEPKNGMEFVLVGDGDNGQTTIVPKRGEKFEIKIRAEFALDPLPMEQGKYRFRLRKGTDSGRFPYEAVLRPIRPIEKSITCKLKLTYEYGAKHPYRLVFFPQDVDNLKPMEAEWGFAEERELRTFPTYPRLKTVNELRRYPKRNSGESQDLMERLTSLFSKINDSLNCPWERGVQQGEIRTSPHIHVEVSVNGIDRRVWINEYWGFHPRDCHCGDGTIIWCRPSQNRHGNWVGLDPVVSERNPTLSEVLKRLKKCRFPMQAVFLGGRSIDSPDFPDDLAELVRNVKSNLVDVCDENPGFVDLKQEYHRFISLLYSDGLSSDLEQEIEDESKEVHPFQGREQYYIQTFSYALGDLSELWQRQLLDLILNRIDFTPCDGVSLLGAAIWRTEKMPFAFYDWCAEEVEQCLDLVRNVLAEDVNDLDKQFSLDEIHRRLNTLVRQWEQRGRRGVHPNEKDSRRVLFRFRLSNFARHLEFLLGLLRLRERPERCPSRLLMTSDWSREIVRQLDVALPKLTLIKQQQNDLSLDDVTWVHLEIGNRPRGEKTPDLFYACRSFLTDSQDAGIRVLDIGETLENNDNE